MGTAYAQAGQMTVPRAQAGKPWGPDDWLAWMPFPAPAGWEWVALGNNRFACQPIP
jgi:hypothetical protein